MRALFLCPLLACASPVAAADEGPAPWENVSDELCKSLGVYDVGQRNGKEVKLDGTSRRVQGLAVEPTTGRVLLLLAKHGLHASKDRGATWTKMEGAKVTGRCECGFDANIAYPYSGRFGLFTIDGIGGLTLDGGETWSYHGRFGRSFDFVDVDWSVPKPLTLFGLRHEPWAKCLSVDGGATWAELDKGERADRLGVFDAATLLEASSRTAGIHVSADSGKTWAKVADFKVLGQHPVHHGKRLYWNTSDGVAFSDDGKEWKLKGAPLPSATWGPYFGKSEDEMLVVSPKGFFVTKDGAKTWANVAPYFAVPEGTGTRPYDKDSVGRYFGWDPVGNVLYAAGMGGSCYRLTLK